MGDDLEMKTRADRMFFDAQASFTFFSACQSTCAKRSTTCFLRIANPIREKEGRRNDPSMSEVSCDHAPHFCSFLSFFIERL